VPEQVAAAWALLPGYLSQHVLLSACALALGVVLSLPLAVLAARKPALRWGVLAAAGLIQTIPGLALLALFYPLLLALGAVLRVDLPALGFLPALLALTLYSMLPILRNAVAGLTGVDADVREAADGVGMTPSQRLWRVEAPLAAPVVMAGVRTAAVWTIGTATLATPVGQVSLGNYIFSGLQTENWVFVLFGCAAAAILALAADALLGLVEAGAARRSGRLAMLGLAGLFAGVAVALWAWAGVGAGSGSRYVVGAKNFSEQFILAEAITKRLSSAGAAVERRDGLGSAVAFRALAAGDLDVYVDYSGTLWANVLGRTDAVGRPAMLDILRRELKARYGVTLLGTLGFENAYALAMTRQQAEALGLRDLDGLAKVAPQLTLGADLEFLSRPEWIGIRDAYGLRFGASKSFNPTFMYRAVKGGEADVISAFSSDGRIAALDLVVLGDPKGAIPAYDAVILLAPGRAQDQRLLGALRPLLGSIAVDRMRRANLMVDRDADKRTPAEAADWLLNGR
jgi:osmoprotectant transport system permease protein